MPKPYFINFNLTAERASELIYKMYEYLANIYENEGILNEQEFIEKMFENANNVKDIKELMYIAYECGRAIATLSQEGKYSRFISLLDMLEEITETKDAKTTVYNRMKDVEYKLK